MSRPTIFVPALAMLALSGCQQASHVEGSAEAATPAHAAAPIDAELLARGEYIARIGGCNDCHTPGYAESGGQVPKAQWLVGSPLGWHGAWGTTYPANLRLKVQDMDEAKWMAYTANLHTRPPMPDFAIRAMTATDRRAIYRFIRSLGPAGQPAPAYLPPDQAPKPPYVDWVLPPPPAKATPPG